MRPLTASQAAAVAAHVRDVYGDDEDLVLGMVEGETDAGEALDAMLAANLEDKAMVNALKEHEAEVYARRKRIANRIEARREGIMAILDIIGVNKWERPLATVSISNIPPKRIVSDESALPDAFCKFTRRPDLTAIKEAEEMPPGVAMDNGGRSLTVRVK